MRIAWIIVFASLLPAGRALAEIGFAMQTEGDIEVGVALDSSEQGGAARANVRIHARRDIVWGLITSCDAELEMVPGLVGCRVLQTAPDGSWQLIHHELDYSWYLPRLAYDIKATYDRPTRVVIERVSGDLRTLRGSWLLESDGTDTVAHYSVDLDTGFWVPRWLVRGALRRDLPRMMRTLRARAESLQRHAPG